MISVYAVAVVKTEKNAAFEAIAQTLCNLSQQDAGCIGYGYGKVQNQADTYAFVEQWQTASDLQNPWHRRILCRLARRWKIFWSRLCTSALLK